VVLQERAADYFAVPDSFESAYMLFVAPVHPRRRRATAGSHSGLQRLNDLRSEIPAVTHVDDSARIQTVDATRNPRLHELLQAFDALTGCPLLVNTSFNVRGEPMVCTPADAYRCFLATEIDVLVIEDFLLHKADQPAAAVAAARARRATLPLD
jgi:carbamoyltransferase